MHVFGRPSPDGVAPSPQLAAKDTAAAQALPHTSAPPTPRGRSASRTSPERDEGSSMPKPKRSGSFGLGLGLSQLAQAVSRKSQSGEAATPSPSTAPLPPPGLLAFTPATPAGAMGPPVTPDASHLGHFSLRLSELVNRALQPCVATSAATTTTSAVGATAKNAVVNAAAPASSAPQLGSIVYEGRRLPSRARVEELAELVVGELRYAAAIDSYLLRAASRQALKSLTLFADRLESLIVSPMRDPSVLFVPTTAKEGTHLPPALEYNLGLASLTWIVEDALERCIEGDRARAAAAMPHFVADILAPVRTKMENTILHVVQPALASVKLCLSACVAKAVPRPFHAAPDATSAASSAPAPQRSPPSSTGSPMLPPSLDWQRELEARLDGCRRLLYHRIAQRTGKDGEGWFISVAIHVIWKGLLVLTSRPMPLPWAVLAAGGASSAPSYHQAFASAAAAEANKRSPSPAQLTNALKAVSSAVARPRRGDSVASSGRSTPIVAPGEPVPRTPQTLVASVKATALQIADLQAFERLMLRFVAGFTETGKTQAPDDDDDDDAVSISSDSSDDDDEDELARAALAEALQAIRSVIVVAQYLDSHPNEILDTIARPRGRGATPATPSALPSEVSRASKAIPPLLLLHLVYACMPLELPSFAASEGAPAAVPSPPALFGLRWPEYDKALAGFGAGQTWALACARGWKEGIEAAWVEASEREAEASRAVEEKTVAPSQPATPAAADGHELERARSESTTGGGTASTPHHDRSSPTDSEVSLPEAMTQSAPNLEALRIADARPNAAGAATKAKPAWGMASFRRSKLGTTKSNNASSPPGTAAGTSSKQHSPSTSKHGSPDASPRLGPELTPTAATVPPSTTALKFWRSSSHARKAGGGKPPSLSLHAAAADGGVSEAKLALERARQEKAALRLLARASEAVAHGAGDAPLEVVLA